MIFNIYLGIFRPTYIHRNLAIIFKYLTNKLLPSIPSGKIGTVRLLCWFKKYFNCSCDSSLPRSPPPYVHPKDGQGPHHHKPEEGCGGCECHYSSQEVSNENNQYELRYCRQLAQEIKIELLRFINVIMSL